MYLLIYWYLSQGPRRSSQIPDILRNRTDILLQVDENPWSGTIPREQGSATDTSPRIGACTSYLKRRIPWWTCSTSIRLNTYDVVIWILEINKGSIWEINWRIGVKCNGGGGTFLASQHPVKYCLTLKPRKEFLVRTLHPDTDRLQSSIWGS